MLLISPSLCHASCNLISRLHCPQRLQPAAIVRPEHPWEANGVYFQGSVLKDDSWPKPFRMWYSAIGEKRREQQYLGYAESADGQHFDKPLRPEWGFGPWAKTNVLYGQRFNIAAPNVHFFAHPGAGQRFFLCFDSRVEQHQFRGVPVHTGITKGDRRKLMRRSFYTPDFDWNRHFPANNGQGRALYLADSTDGLSWEPADGRYAIAGQSDGDHTCAYDPRQQLYRLYFRGNRLDENGQRIRQVFTASSRDTIDWSTPELCLESDAIDDPRVNQIHGMTVTWHRGLYIGLIQMMTILDEIDSGNPVYPFELARFHVQLAISRDGIHFERIADRGEFFAPAPDPAAFDYGIVRCSGQWVFDGGRMLMYYDGRPYPHARVTGKEGSKALIGQGLGADVGIGVAASPRDRFAGLSPRDVVQPGYATIALPAAARRITLNCAVPQGSSVSASLRHPDGCRIAGWDDGDCQAIRQDAAAAPLVWNGAAELPTQPRPLHLRLRVTGPAVLYALDFPEK